MPKTTKPKETHEVRKRGSKEQEGEELRAESKPERQEENVRIVNSMSFEEFFAFRTAQLSSDGSFNRKHHPEWHYAGCNGACKDCDPNQESPQTEYNNYKEVVK